MSFDADRYSRQVRFAPIGVHGQERLAAAHVALVGCGALGGVVALALVRAGIGRIRIIDRDVPELSNLPRQVLFDEADVAAGLPKAVAAASHLRRINAACRIDPIVADLTPASAPRLLGDVDVIVDGTDNFEARFLINELACREGIPWVHGGAIGAEGRVLAVLPGRSACLRCLVPDPPAPGALPTCDTAGVIGPVALVVGAVEAAEVMKIIVGTDSPVGNRLLVCDLWDNLWRCVDLAPLAVAGCPTCREHDFPWLEGRAGTQAAVLCGRDAVQVAPAPGLAGIDLAAFAERMAAVGGVVANRWIVRVTVEEGLELAVFADGRTIVSGTRDEARARGLVARYVGN